MSGPSIVVPLVSDDTGTVRISGVVREERPDQWSWSLQTVKMDGPQAGETEGWLMTGQVCYDSSHEAMRAMLDSVRQYVTEMALSIAVADGAPLSKVGSPEQCYRRAAEALELASQARTIAARMSLCALAECWRRLARDGSGAARGDASRAEVAP